MFVINRKGLKEPVRYDQITDRNMELAQDLTKVDPAKLSQSVISSLKDGMTTAEIDILSAETAFYMSAYEPEYDKLAARIAVRNLHKQTSDSFVETMKLIHSQINPHTGKRTNVINEEFLSFIESNREVLDTAIDYERDFSYGYFGFKTLEKSYLLKVNKKVVERPQHMVMRVACGIHSPNQALGKAGNLKAVLDTYNLMSQGLFTHASPTLFNSGSNRPQLSSCFLLHMADDLEHIYQTNLRSALISKHAGGIGIDITNVRGKGSPIHSTNGTSDGIVPMIQVFNATARYANQCFSGNTPVLTKNGWVDIENIKVGDQVLAESGLWREVSAVHERSTTIDEKVYQVSTNSSTFHITADHQVCYLEGNKKVYKSFESGISEINDFVFPIPTSREKTKLDDVLRFLFIVFFMTAKYFEEYIEIRIPNQICAHFERCLKHFKITYRCQNWNSVYTFLIDKDDIPDETKFDYIKQQQSTLPVEIRNLENIEIENNVNWMLSCFEVQIKDNILSVLFEEEISKKKHQILELVYQLWLLSYNLKYNSSDSTVDIYKCTSTDFLFPNKNISQHPQVDINKFEFCDKTTSRFTTYLIDNKIRSCEQVQVEMKVYDLTVEEDHSYVTPLGLVHNSGKRKGSIAMYLQPWHPDVFEFLALRYQTPPEDLRARDIFIALWVPDLFMKRVQNDEMWSLICPSQVPALCETYGDEWEEIYCKAERNCQFVRKVKARDVWQAILQSQQETGLPYIAYKDSINRKSNQKNIGIIRSSNLCIEIVEFTDKDSVAVCNLASIALPKYLEKDKINWELLGKVVEQIVDNLNNIIDINYYPIPEARNNNLAYRPIGIGIQGLADLIAMMKCSWGSNCARYINRCVMEVIYYHAIKRSNELGVRDGSYSKFEGSPLSLGQLQCDLWGEKEWTRSDSEMFLEMKDNGFQAPVLDWDGLRHQVKSGMRNSLLVALMPTASTAQILGNNESFEPFTSNIFSRSVLAGNFTVVNQHLYRDLSDLGLWNKSLVNKIIENNGSVQGIKEIPSDIQERYKTVWEISQKIVIDYAAERGPFVCQTQSMNIFMANPTTSKLSSMHMYGWTKGLKTGQYYLRSKPATNAIKFTTTPTSPKSQPQEKVECTEEVCTMCSS